MTARPLRPLHERSEPSVFYVLDVLRDLMLGGRHSRATVARACDVSLPTADRWLQQLEERVPGVERVKVGRVAWLQYAGVRFADAALAKDRKGALRARIFGPDDTTSKEVPSR